MATRQHIADRADRGPVGLDEIARFCFGGIEIIDHDVGTANRLGRDLAHLRRVSPDGIDVGPGPHRIVIEQRLSRRAWRSRRCQPPPRPRPALCDRLPTDPIGQSRRPARVPTPHQDPFDRPHRPDGLDLVEGHGSGSKHRQHPGIGPGEQARGQTGPGPGPNRGEHRTVDQSDR